MQADLSGCNALFRASKDFLVTTLCVLALPQFSTTFHAPAVFWDDRVPLALPAALRTEARRLSGCPMGPRIWLAAKTCFAQLIPSRMSTLQRTWKCTDPGRKTTFLLEGPFCTSMLVGGRVPTFFWNLFHRLTVPSAYLDLGGETGRWDFFLDRNQYACLGVSACAFLGFMKCQLEQGA